MCLRVIVAAKVAEKAQRLETPQARRRLRQARGRGGAPERPKCEAEDDEEHDLLAAQIPGPKSLHRFLQRPLQA